MLPANTQLLVQSRYRQVTVGLLDERCGLADEAWRRIAGLRAEKYFEQLESPGGRGGGHQPPS
jgi:hypothetical protein